MEKIEPFYFDGLDYEQFLQELEKDNDSIKKILVDMGFWDVNGNYREDFQIIERSELNGANED